MVGGGGRGARGTSSENPLPAKLERRKARSVENLRDRRAEFKESAGDMAQVREGESLLETGEVFSLERALLGSEFTAEV